MNDSRQELLVQVKDVLVDTLGLQDQATGIGPETRLFGSLPELDSLAVAELLVELENRLDIKVEDSEVTAEDFATLATLTEFVAKTRA